MSKSKQDINEVTRYRKSGVVRELWVRVPGQSQFSGCRRISLGLQADNLALAIKVGDTYLKRGLMLKLLTGASNQKSLKTLRR